MSEPGDTQKDTSPRDGTSEAQLFLQTEFARCKQALVSFDGGVERMRQGQANFDETWGEIVRNAVRLFGRVATREALDAMGRSEDAALLYG